MPLLTALLDQFRQSRARTAIEVAGDVWTYGRLDEASSRIAGSLAGSDAPVDRPVAVLAEHGPGLIAAIVGVVRSGRCYLALNPSASDMRRDPTGAADRQCRLPGTRPPLRAAAPVPGGSAHRCGRPRDRSGR